MRGFAVTSRAMSPEEAKMGKSTIGQHRKDFFANSYEPPAELSPLKKTGMNSQDSQSYCISKGKPEARKYCFLLNTMLFLPQTFEAWAKLRSEQNLPEISSGSVHHWTRSNSWKTEDSETELSRMASEFNAK